MENVGQAFLVNPGRYRSLLIPKPLLNKDGLLAFIGQLTAARSRILFFYSGLSSPFSTHQSNLSKYIIDYI